MSINHYSFKYICVVCNLKLRFYCLTCSAISNLNSADFTTPNSHQRFKQNCCLSFKIRQTSKLLGSNYCILDSPQIRQIQVCEIQTCQIHIYICQIQIYPVNILFVYKTEDVVKTCLQDVFKTFLQDVFSVTIFCFEDACKMS